MDRWLRDKRNGRLFKWTQFLSVQPHFEEVAELPRQHSTPQGDCPAREVVTTQPLPTSADKAVLPEQKDSPPSVPEQQDVTARRTPRTPPPDEPGKDVVKVADKLRIEITREGKRRN